MQGWLLCSLSLLLPSSSRSCLPQDLLSASELEIMEDTGLTIQRAREAIMAAARATAPTLTTALRRLQSPDPRFISTGLPQLDSVLQGGLPVSTIAEVMGPSGCGKTQFCMLLAVMVS